MKRAFALLLSIVIIALFALAFTQVSLTRSLQASNQTNHYVYTQALLHKDFFKELILDMKKLECQEHLILENPVFDIQATLTYSSTQNNCTQTQAVVDIFVSPKNSSLFIRVHERFIKKL